MDSLDADGDELTILSREELEERVRRRTAALENVMNTMVDVLVKLGPDGRIQLANAAVSDVLGYEPDSLRGRPFDALLADEERADDGRSVDPADLVDRLVREGRLTEVETHLVTADGEAIPTSLSASVLRDDDGTLEGIVCVATDITERADAEDRAAFLHSLLRHDLGNKLGVASGYLDLLAETDLTDEQRRYLRFAADGVEETITMAENIRTLNRLDGEETARPTNLRTVLDASVDRHADLADLRGFTVRTAVDDATTVVGGSLLSECFANLIENALVHSEGSLLELTVVEEASTVRVHVDDDGRGIPRDRRESIVERGVSGAASTGSGLGTHLAARIARTYGGDLAVEASPLGGARFTVTLERHVPEPDR